MGPWGLERKMAASFQMCVVWKCLTIIMCDGDDGMSNESFTRCMVVLIIPLLSFFAMTTKISNVDVVFISIVLWGDSFLANSKVPSIPFTNGAPKPCINGR